MKRLISVITTIFIIFALSASAFAYTSQDISLPSVLGLVKMENLSNTSGYALYATDHPMAYSNRENNTVYGALPNAGDVEMYSLEVDHSITPNFTLCFSSFGLPCNFMAKVYNEDGSYIKGATVLNSHTGYDIPCPRRFLTLSNNDAEESLKTYIIEITALTANTGYAITLGSMDTFADDFSGNIYTTVAKNDPSEDEIATAQTSFFQSYQSLLNIGDWYHYTADGYTYITASILHYNNLAFEVYDADTGIPVYVTTPDENNKARYETYDNVTELTGVVQAGINLEPGHDYFIRFYCTTPIRSEGTSNIYNIFIGHPNLVSYKSDYKSAAYSIPANTTKTIKIHISEFPLSARASRNTVLKFTPYSSSMEPNFKSCKITAPNGYSFFAQYGHYSSFNYPNPINFLGDPNNIPINGDWTITVSTTQAVSRATLRFSHARIIDGNFGN